MQQPYQESSQSRLIPVQAENSILNTETICPRCESTDYFKRGKSKKGNQYYQCKNCQRCFSQTSLHRQGLPLSDDVWDAAELGLRVHKHLRYSKLVFRHIHQFWLKVAVKQFVLYMARSNQLELATLLRYMSTFNGFSQFLLESYPSIDFSTINRSVILEYLGYLTSKKVSADCKSHCLSHLKNFWETGVLNKWFDVTSHLIHDADFPKQISGRLPRYIPEEVMQQLNQHLDALPEPVMRMVLVIQECGLRVSELLQLTIDCLRQDSQGNWYLQFTRWKMKKEDTIPVSSELATLIKEQQQYIQSIFANRYEYLFCTQTSGSYHRDKKINPHPRVMKINTFAQFLKDLAEEFDIQDNSGKRWNFQTHQFRHTVGTRMINSGVPQHIVQRYLGHESPNMTSVYAHIHDETLRREVEKYYEARTTFNIAGQIVELEQSATKDDADLEWFKRNVLAMALPHGWCGRPKVLGHCTLPPNSCLDCAHLRTNKNFLEVFKDELKRTLEILAKAKKYGWEVQVQMNEPIKANLEKLIAALETND